MEEIREVFLEDLIETYNIPEDVAEELWAEYKGLILDDMWQAYTNAVEYIADEESL